MFTRTVATLQAKYEGHFTLDFLKSVQPFVAAALAHPKAKISGRARSMWEITWAKKLPAKHVPPEIATCLRSRCRFYKTPKPFGQIILLKNYKT
jgi:hypothetical protein